MKDTLSACPSCSGPLLIRAYQCPECSTEILGSFSGCPFCRMSDENRYFCLVFLQCEGNMKDVERIMEAERILNITIIIIGILAAVLTILYAIIVLF